MAGSLVALGAASFLIGSMLQQQAVKKRSVQPPPEIPTIYKIPPKVHPVDAINENLRANRRDWNMALENTPEAIISRNKIKAMEGDAQAQKVIASFQWWRNMPRSGYYTQNAGRALRPHLINQEHNKWL